MKNMDKQENTHITSMYKAVFDASADAIMIFRDGKIIDCNEKTLSIFKVKKEEILGKAPWDLSPEFQPDGQKSVDAATKLIDRVLEGNPQHFYWVHKDFQEHTIEMEISLNNVETDRDMFVAILRDITEQKQIAIEKDKNGNISRMVGIQIDITDRKQAEINLLERESQLKMIIENIPTVIWKSDENGNTSYISPNIKKVYGYNPEDIYNEGEDLWLKRIHPDDLEKVLSGLEKLFTKNKPYNVEYRIKHKKGHWVWLHDRADVVIEENSIRYAYGIFSDISEKKKHEKELIESEQKYRSLIDFMPLGIVIRGGETIEFCNKKACEITGYSQKQLIGTNLKNVLFPEDYKKANLRMSEMLYGNGYANSIEVSLIKKDGSTVPVESVGTRISLYGETKMISAFLDISKRKKAEKNFFEKSSRLELALKSTKTSIWEYQPLNEKKHISDEFWLMLGYNPEKINDSRKMWTSLLHPDDHSSILDKEKSFIKSKNNEYFSEYRIKNKKGEYLWIDSHGLTTERDDKGNISRILGTHTNITDKKTLQLEKEIQEKMLIRSQRMASLGGLTSAIAHEIRQPLNLIKIISDTISYALSIPESDRPKNLKVDQKMEQISQAVMRIDDTIRNLQALFKSSDKIKKEKCDINQLIQNTLKFYNERLHNHSISLKTEYAESLEPVIVSPIQFQEIISNLINNAMDSLDSSGISHKQILITTGKNKEGLLIIISDNGPGIDIENQEKIFDPFYSTKTKKEGMGMGLYIVHSIVKDMNGKISVSSVPGKKTEFKLEILK